MRPEIYVLHNQTSGNWLLLSAALSFGARKGELGRVVIVAKISEGMLFLKLKEEDASGKGLENHIKFY